MSPRSIAVLAALAVVAPGAAAQVPDRSRPPELGPPPTLTLPAIQRLTLSNGLTLIYLPKRAVPLVQVNVVVRAGQIHEADGQAGLASMTAAMLDEGAGARSALELADAIDFLGATLGVGGDQHAVRIALHVPKDQLDPALEVLADVVLRPRFDGEELERQRRQRLTAMSQWHDEARVIAAVVYARTLYGERHPYGRLTLGTPASVAALTVEHLRAFHRTYFVPNNAAVIVVGDVSLEEIRPRLEAAFGAWTRGSVPAPRPPAAPPASRREVVLVDKPGAAQSEIRIGQVGVDRKSPDYFALQVMNTVLGGSFTSRLNQKLREEKQYTYGAGSGFSYGLYQGPFTAQAAVQTAVTDSALVEFLRELRGMLEAVPPEELARARNYQALRYPARFQAVGSIAGELEDLYLYDLPSDYFNAFVPRVLAVTPADVRRVARRYLTPDRMAVIVVGDRSRIEAGVRALQLGPIRVLSVVDVLGPPPVVGSN
jgi:predicted Zn-dependent peptidase